MIVKLVHGLTELFSDGCLRGVKGELEVRLCARSKPFFFLLDTQWIGLQSLQLKTSTFPNRPKCGQTLIQHFLSTQTYFDLQDSMEKKSAVIECFFVHT